MIKPNGNSTIKWKGLDSKLRKVFRKQTNKARRAEDKRQQGKQC